MYNIRTLCCVVVDIPLRKNVQSAAIQVRQKTSLEIWDKRREEQLGKEGGLWDVVYCLKSKFRPSVQFISFRSTL